MKKKQNIQQKETTEDEIKQLEKEIEATELTQEQINQALGCEDNWENENEEETKEEEKGE